MRTRIRSLVLGLTLAMAAACGSAGPRIPPETPKGPPLPFTAGTYDCAAPATWKTTSFAKLVPTVQRALANDQAQDALTVLLSSHYDEEVTCVTGYIHDESVKQRDSAADKDMPAQRVLATQTWMDAQSARGLTVTNYAGEAH